MDRKERRTTQPIIDMVGRLQVAERRREGAEISEAHSESHLRNVARLTQLVGGFYGFNRQENNLAYFAGTFHDLVRSSREDPSVRDEVASARQAKKVLEELHIESHFLTEPEEREAVSYAIENHSTAPAFFNDPETRNDVPESLADRLHTALFVADKLEANGVRVIARRSSFVAGDRLHGGDWNDYGFEPGKSGKDKDEYRVVAIESLMRLAFINPESMYPKRLQPFVGPLYETQREFVRGLFSGAGLSMSDVAEMMLNRKRDDGQNYLQVNNKKIGKKENEVRKIIDEQDGQSVNKLTKLLVERTGITDDAIAQVDSDVSASALETVDYFSSRYKEDLDGLVETWQPAGSAAQEWKQGMIEYADGTWFENMQK